MFSQVRHRHVITGPYSNRNPLTSAGGAYVPPFFGGMYAARYASPCNRPLTRPAPAGENAGRGPPSPQGRGRRTRPRGARRVVRKLPFSEAVGGQQDLVLRVSGFAHACNAHRRLPFDRAFGFADSTPDTKVRVHTWLLDRQLLALNVQDFNFFKPDGLLGCGAMLLADDTGLRVGPGQAAILVNVG